MIGNFDIGKDLQDAFDDGYNRRLEDVIKIVKEYEKENKLDLGCLLEILIKSK